MPTVEAADLIAAPTVGLHRDIPFEQYQRIKLPNSSAIGWGRVSMKHMKACVDGTLEDNDTKDRKFGRAVHCILLEPDRLEERFVVSLPCQAKLQSGNRKGERCGGSSKMQAVDGGWYCGVHNKGMEEAPLPDGTEIVTVEEDLRLHQMRDALRSHLVMKVLTRPGWSELSVVWDRLGVRLKGRIDRFADGPVPLIIDVKKTRVGYCGMKEVEQSISGFEWHRQAALYHSAIDSLVGVKPEFLWLFVEDGPPFDLNVVPIDDESLAIGLTEADEVLRRWVHACETNNFPGYIADVANLPRGGLPEWHKRKFEEQRVR